MQASAECYRRQVRDTQISVQALRAKPEASRTYLNVGEFLV